jgi:hypothetical protein
MACATLPDTLFVGCDDGALYRVGKYSTPVRPNYSRHSRTIETVADLKATLRAGAYAWPGGYALYFVTADGAALSFAAARAEFATIASAIRDGRTDSGWRIVGTASTADDDDTVVCDHTGQPIE